jgi:hypothetical protein
MSLTSPVMSGMNQVMTVLIQRRAVGVTAILMRRDQAAP